ncbi:MAG: hypothetical protein HY901_06355 [Deltaproteobacteria bacterium]|nr:hypothetical protein [Deltaproteobacteria bacterium]
MLVFLPELHSAVELDEHGVGRLRRALVAGQAPISAYRSIAFGRKTDHLAGRTLKEIVLLIAEQSDGFDVALEILFMRLFSDRSAKRKHEPELIEAGCELLQRVTFRKDNQGRDYELAGVAKACLTAHEAGSIAAKVATRVRQAIAAHETSSFSSHDLLTALLEAQPAAVLDALFAGNDREKLAGVAALDDLSENRNKPMDAVSCEELVAWCNRDREHRYPLAASIITYARSSKAAAGLVWSEQATALLANTPDPVSVLNAFLQRFRPMAWCGSRAALIEANARLLDSLNAQLSTDLMPFITEAKAKLAHVIARERRCETEFDRARDEQFE